MTLKGAGRKNLHCQYLPLGVHEDAKKKGEGTLFGDSCLFGEGTLFFLTPTKAVQKMAVIVGCCHCSKATGCQVAFDFFHIFLGLHKRTKPPGSGADFFWKCHGRLGEDPPAASSVRSNPAGRSGCSGSSWPNPRRMETRSHLPSVVEPPPPPVVFFFSICTALGMVLTCFCCLVEFIFWWVAAKKHGFWRPYRFDKLLPFVWGWGRLFRREVQ